MHRYICSSGKQGMNVQPKDSDNMAATREIQISAKITRYRLEAQFESVCTTTDCPTARENT